MISLAHEKRRLIDKGMSKENINGIVQIEAAAEYEKAAKGPLKKYPSLELVRLEKLFFIIRKNPHSTNHILIFY